MYERINIFNYVAYKGVNMVLHIEFFPSYLGLLSEVFIFIFMYEIYK